MLAAIVAAAAILGGLAIWRLSQGPVEITFLTPFIQQALDQPDSPVSVSVGNADITWENWDRAVEVRALDVVVRSRADDAVVLTLPEVSIGLTLAGIDSGIIAPTSVRLTDAVLALHRLEDGSVTMSLEPARSRASATDGGGSPGVPGQGADLLHALMRPPGESGYAGALRQFVMRNARLRITDAILGLDVVADQGDLILSRDSQGIAGALDANILLDGKQIPIHADLRKEFAEPEMAMELGFRDLAPESVSGLLPDATSWLAGVDLPVSGTLRTSFSLEDRPRDFTLRLTSAAGTLGADIAWDGGDAPMEALVDVAGVDLALLAAKAPRLAPYLPLRAVLNGTIRFHGDPATGLGDAEIAIDAGAGELVMPEFWPEPLPVTQAHLQGLVRDLGQTAVLDQLRLEFDQGTALELSGHVDPLGDGGRQVTLSAVASNVDAARLPVLWPKKLGTNAWEWVTGNIPAGFVPKANADVVLEFGADLNAEPKLVSLTGGIDIERAEVHYLRPLPPVTGIDAHASFGPDWMTIEGRTGRLLDSRIGESKVEITKIGTKDDMVVTVAVAGPLSDAMTILDHERFGFIRALGVDSKGLTGDTDARVTLGFELKRDLKLDSISASAKAQIRNLVQANGPLGLDVRADTVMLDVDTKGMVAKGPVRLNNVLFALAWDERFSESEARRSRYDLSGTVTTQELARLGMDAGEYAAGKVTAALRYDIARNGGQSFQINANLAEMAISVPEIGLDKPGGEALKAEMTGRIAREGAPVQLSRLTLSGPGMDADLSGTLKPGFAGLGELAIARFRRGGTDVSGAIALLDDGSYRVGLTGPSLDAGFYFDRKDDAPEDAQAPAPAEEEPGTPLQISLAVDRLLTTEGHMLQGVTGRIQRGPDRMERVEIDGQTAPGAPLSIRYLPDNAGGHTLAVDIADAGAALTALGWTGRVQGGALKLSGARTGPDLPLSGTVEMLNFTVRDAPAMVKILEFLSLTGALSALRESGLEFQRLEGRFSWLDGVLTVDFARAYGSSIGITARGKANTKTDEIDMEGAVIPAYVVNRVLGSIPILGWIITGGEGEGLFAANYAVHGKVEDPEVTVNPLSVLAPGILRQILGLEAAEPGAGGAAQPTPGVNDSLNDSLR